MIDDNTRYDEEKSKHNEKEIISNARYGLLGCGNNLLPFRLRQ